MAVYIYLRQIGLTVQICNVLLRHWSNLRVLRTSRSPWSPFRSVTRCNQNYQVLCDHRHAALVFTS